MDSLTANSLERNGADAEAQRAARDAIMEIPAFPELQTRLTRVFGPGPERDMVHQLVYWFSKPKMQDRWTAYLTRENWRDQRGLNRKQVDKGRRRLKVHPSGVVEEKMGPYKRIHYRIDWVKLADLLGLQIPLKGVPMEDDFDDFDIFGEEDLRPPLKGMPEPSAPPLGGSESLAPPEMDDIPDIYAENHANGGVPSNTGAFAGAYSQNNHPTGCAEPAFAEPAPPEINKNDELKEGLAPPPEDKRHSQNGHTPSESRLERRETPTLSGDMKVKVWMLVSGRAEEQVLRRFADNHIWNKRDSEGEPFTIGRVAEKAREVLQGEEPLEAYVSWVERLIEDRLWEMADAEKAVFEAVA